MKSANGKAQISLWDELIVDSFAGGGGASTGIELAAGRPVNIAVNHDPAAILMHRTNHPFTEHYCESVWDVDPVNVCRGRPVGLAWFSPDCKHFSKAKGAALADRKIRGLAWVVLRWAGTVRPRVIIVENVEEFQTWGPVRKGKPVRKLAGQTFRKWLEQLRSLGYAAEYKELTAADYGTPTTRKRFVLIARCDGRPIVWPEPTRSRNGDDNLKRWIPAADIIDWNLPSYSIFATRRELKERYGVTAVRPLAENTLRRVIRGVDRFTIRSGKPFLVRVPLPAAVSLIPCRSERDERAQSVGETLRSSDLPNRYSVASAHLVEYFGEGRPLNLAEPLRTVTSHDKEALVLVRIRKYFDGGADNPLPTATTLDHNALCAAHIVEFKGQDIGQDAARPLRTITASIGQFAECRTEIVRADSGRDLERWPEIRALLNRFCGYCLGDDEILLLMIDGVAWFLSDISLRMLTPRELYRAMGFPADYVIDRDDTGKPYPKSAQVARCGNAVCPPMAAALVRANFPEWSQQSLTCMSALAEMIAV